jgi:hypothetical protein
VEGLRKLAVHHDQGREAGGAGLHKARIIVAMPKTRQVAIAPNHFQGYR